MYKFILGLLILCATTELTAHTANKVWFVLTNYGRYRVYVSYTVPEIKEFREAYVEFAEKAKAENFYFDLLRGADFYYPNAEEKKFNNHPLKPQPW